MGTKQAMIGPLMKMANPVSAGAVINKALPAANVLDPVGTMARKTIASQDTATQSTLLGLTPAAPGEARKTLLGN